MKKKNVKCLDFFFLAHIEKLALGPQDLFGLHRFYTTIKMSYNYKINLFTFFFLRKNVSSNFQNIDLYKINEKVEPF